jgi:hypothetical protein
MPITSPIPLVPINYNDQIQSVANETNNSSNNNWISTALSNGGGIFGGIADIISSVKGNVAPAPINNYYTQPTSTKNAVPTEYIIGGVVLVLIIAAAVYFKK